MEDTLSTLIDSLVSLKRSKKELDLQLDDVESQIRTVEDQLMKAMDADGVVQTASRAARISITESIYPQVEQWELFSEFILKNGYLHLLERRPAVLAYRELVNLGRAVPGVLPFTKRKLNFKEL